MKASIRVIVVFLLALHLASTISAQESVPEQILTEEEARQEARRINIEQQLEDLVKALNAARKDADELRAKLAQATDETEKEELKAELTKLREKVTELLIGLEKVATGGAKIRSLEEDSAAVFDWKKELQDVFKPIVVELKRLTERPRQIERLRSEIAFYEERMPVAEGALAALARYREHTLTPELQAELDQLLERWTQRRNDLKNHLQVTRLELDDLLQRDDDVATDAFTNLREFAEGRGLSILIALLAFSLTYYLLSRMQQFYAKRTERGARVRKRFTTRLASLLFSSLTFLVALFAAMIVFSVRGDWLLLGLIIIVLVAAVLAVRNSIPRYLAEARIMLNIGPVRERERVLYAGLPWKVASINVYSTLVNPALTGGLLRLPLSEMVNLVSRPFDDGESWFPTREGDYVLLSDSTFGQVLQQTPEYVRLVAVGAVQTYSTDTFLGMTPRNLSIQGFGIAVTLGLDYRYQAEITTDVRDRLEHYVADGLAGHEYGKHLKKLIVEFNEAGASSLDILVVGLFNQNAAPDYFPIRRLLSRLTVEACNHHGWSIPFNQISVHMETPVEFASLPDQSRAPAGSS